MCKVKEFTKRIERQWILSDLNKKYYNKKFDALQKEVILKCKELGFDTDKIANPDFDPFQMDEILEGLISGIDITFYNTIDFDCDQMHQIRLGLEQGVNVMFYASPNNSEFIMRIIREELEKIS